MSTIVTELGFANVVAAWHAYASRARYLQWGTGSGQDESDTDLADKTGTTEARTAGTTSQETTDVTGDTYRVTGAIAALTDSLAITEVGIFDAAGSGSPPSGGNMGLYGDFSQINLDTGDSIIFTFDVVVAGP